MSERPIVSGVMAVYNGEKYLSEAIQSVLDQTLEDFELIVIDDGSSDNTLEVLAQYAARDPRVIVISEGRRGLVGSLNRGVRQARGRLIARMDADDVAEPCRFESQVAFLRDHPDHVVVGSQLMLIDAEGEVVGPRNVPCRHEDILERCLMGDGAIPHPSAMIRTEAIAAVNGYREQFPNSQDIDLWLRIAEKGKLANLDQSLLRYRIHENSITFSSRRSQLREAQQAVNEARARAGLPALEKPIVESREWSSSSRVLRQWTKLAMKSGNKRAARNFVRRALELSPGSLSNWWLWFRVSLSMP